MTNEELVEQIQSGVNVQANMGLLYEQNVKSIEYLSYRYACKIQNVQKEDLMQEAYLALVQAVNAFDFTKTQVFYPYFELRMKTRFERYCSSATYTKKIPDYFIRKIIKYSAFIKEYLSKHDAEPSDIEIMEYLDLSQKQLEHLKQTIVEADCLSLDEIYTDGGDEWISNISDGIDMEDRIICSLLQEHCKKILWTCVDSLNARESVIVHEIYEENKTIKEIAELESCSDDAIRIVEKKVLEKLKSMDEIKYIACELNLISNLEYNYDFIGKTSLKFFKLTGLSSVESAVIKKMDVEKNKVKLQRLLKQMKNGSGSKELLLGIDRLKEKYRQLLTLRYIDGYSMKDVAKIMNMNKTYVSGLHATALNLLNEMILSKAV